jgi:hypothetical protein
MNQKCRSCQKETYDHCMNCLYPLCDDCFNNLPLESTCQECRVFACNPFCRVYDCLRKEELYEKYGTLTVFTFNDYSSFASCNICEKDSHITEYYEAICEDGCGAFYCLSICCGCKSKEKASIKKDIKLAFEKLNKRLLDPTRIVKEYFNNDYRERVIFRYHKFKKCCGE